MIKAARFDCKPIPRFRFPHEKPHEKLARRDRLCHCLRMNVPAGFAIFGASFAAGLSGALMPGPVLTATVAQALRRGRWAGPLIVLGHAFPEMAILALVLGRGEALLRRPAVLGAIGILGGLLLLAMGIDILRSRRRAARETQNALRADRAGGPPLGHPVSAGILLSLTNPYWTLWWATFGLGLAGQALETLGLAGLVIFFAGHILADFTWYSSVSFGVAAGRRSLPVSFFSGLLAVCGAAMLILAVKFLRDGILRFL